MSHNSKYLKDTGLIIAYQNFIKQLMNSGIPDGDVFLEASKFFQNYEKKHKVSSNVEPLPQDDALFSKEKKERKKIVLETKNRIHPSVPIITPQIFERQERSRPLIGNYKKEPLDYRYNDILAGRLIDPEDQGPLELARPAMIEPEKAPASIEFQKEVTEASRRDSSIKSRKSSKESKSSHSDRSNKSNKSDKSKKSKQSKQSKKSKKSKKSSESDN
ncbi:hypothetical protein SteCoe_24275 [Stentor coeruleus]|uniref:Uncharacterized protein n=1 Tax=Stentor coeruleus TaxID=5963 RepID=A0A1R2BI30_9CILI|nr:hypothetical protein SteCoe_24275 [Stentor coeruleus]